ncbi:uncharacterized protein LOC134266650 [Saccostrea cucullata]|uniref:uncharacterized protein LOC134266650 n=1 Tax=Saccostrea cuccullata TaxID=36930 RepID=UPI002ED63952
MPPKRKRSRVTKAAEPTESQPKRSAPSKDLEIVDTIQNAIQAAIPGITKAVMDEISKQQTSTDTAIMPSPSAPEGEAANDSAVEPTVNLGPGISGPMYKYGPSAISSSPNNANTLKDIATAILKNSLAPTSRAAYEKTFAFYADFMSTYFPNVSLLPPTTEHLAHFIAFCFQSNIAASTLKTYISALSYNFKIQGFEDPSQQFVIRKMLQGYQKLKTVGSDTRLPITTSILKQLVTSLDKLGISAYLCSMLKAMYLLAFHAFLRVGEITVSSSTNVKNVLNLVNVKLVSDKLNSSESLEITMDNFKHSAGKHIPTLILQRNESEEQFCPVQAIQLFLKVRGQSPGPLFAYPNGDGLLRQHFTNYLQMSLKWAGLNTSHYKGHSFRIGAATCAAAMRISEEKIKRMGRWHSDAFKKYIRIPVLHI